MLITRPKPSSAGTRAWLFDGEHSLVIQQIAPGRVRFTQREQFTGLLVRSTSADTLAQFRAMNTALACQASQLP